MDVKTTKCFPEETYRRTSLWPWGRDGYSNHDTQHEKVKGKKMTTLNLRPCAHQKIPQGG